MKNLLMGSIYLDLFGSIRVKRVKRVKRVTRVKRVMNSSLRISDQTRSETAENFSQLCLTTRFTRFTRVTRDTRAAPPDGVPRPPPGRAEVVG